MRIFSPQFIGAEPLLFQLPVAEIFQEYVGAGQQPVHRLAVLLFAEVENDAALAAIEQREERRSHSAKAAGLVTGRRLDLDHIGAELRQNHAAGRTHHHMGHLDHPHARQRQSRPGHPRLHCSFRPRLSPTLGFHALSEKYNLANSTFSPLERRCRRFEVPAPMDSRQLRYFIAVYNPPSEKDLIAEPVLEEQMFCVGTAEVIIGTFGPNVRGKPLDA
jgi:hypothetical protein